MHRRHQLSSSTDEPERAAGAASGRFLEFSVATLDVRASLDFYATLGFSQAVVGEAWSHPYAVMTDGRICVGLHQTALAGAALLTFIRPDLLKNLSAFEKLGVEFEYRRLGADVFNEVLWRDPADNAVRLVEARTFSPMKRAGTDHSRCGYFLEIALPAGNIGISKAFWERFGFVGMDEADSRLPHVCCMSDTIDLGLYDQRTVGRPSLLFECADVDDAIGKIAAVGIEPVSVSRGGRGAAHFAVLTAPEGTPILISTNA